MDYVDLLKKKYNKSLDDIILDLFKTNEIKFQALVSTLNTKIDMTKYIINLSIEKNNYELFQTIYQMNPVMIDDDIFKSIVDNKADKILDGIKEDIFSYNIDFKDNYKLLFTYIEENDHTKYYILGALIKLISAKLKILNSPYTYNLYISLFLNACINNNIYAMSMIFIHAQEWVRLTENITDDESLNTDLLNTVNDLYINLLDNKSKEDLLTEFKNNYILNELFK